MVGRKSGLRDRVKCQLFVGIDFPCGLQKSIFPPETRIPLVLLKIRRLPIRLNWQEG